MPFAFSHKRRRLLLRGLALTGVATGALGSSGPSYRRLKEPVVVPRHRVNEPWQAVTFDAFCCAADAGVQAQILLRGLLLRLPAVATIPKRFQAFCLLCPHEMCHVDLQHQTDRLPLPPPRKHEHPLFICPCHFSAFDPLAEGALVAGPAGRGLFRFQLAVSEDRVSVVAVEDGALYW
jgi:Rieske Fe-S protein